VEYTTDVLILLPLLNESATIQKTLDSISIQSHQNFIIFAQDNASTDNTFDLLMENASRDPRIVISRKKSRLGMTEN